MIVVDSLSDDLGKNACSKGFDGGLSILWNCILI